MEFNDLKKTWQSKDAHANDYKQLSDKSILEERKMESASSIKRSLYFTLYFGIILALAGLISSITIFSDQEILMPVLFLSLMFAFQSYLAYKQIKQFEVIDDRDKTTQEYVKGFIDFIKRNYIKNAIFSISLSITLFVVGIYTYMTLKYGYFSPDPEDLIVWSSLLIIAIIINYISYRFSLNLKIAELKSILKELDEGEWIAKKEKYTTITISLFIIGIIVLLTIIFFI
jgi:hypothetical protein